MFISGGVGKNTIRYKTKYKRLEGKGSLKPPCMSDYVITSWSGALDLYFIPMKW